MSDRKLAILGIIAVVMAGLAFLQSRLGRSYKAAQITVFPLIEGLDIDRIEGLRITSKDTAEPILLERKESGFVVRNKQGYPAQIQKVNSLISDCVDIRISSDALITSNPENHAELGVTAETARYGIEFLDGDQTVIVGLFISETKTQEDASFSHVRLAGENDVYRLRETPYLSIRPMDYIPAQVVEVDRETIERVTVTDPNQASFTLLSPETGSEIVLESMPPGKQFKGSNHRTLFGALTYFRADDVLAASDVPSLDFTYTYVCQLRNHLVYTVRLAEKDQMWYARLSARYTGPEPEVQKQVESEEQLRQREALFLAKEAAETFVHKHSGWIYQIPAFKADEMTRPLSELLEEIPAPSADSPSEEQEEAEGAAEAVSVPVD